MTVKEAAEALEAALKTVPGLRVYRDPGAVVDPPGAVLGPPALTWEAVCDDPTSARFLVYLVEKVDDRALERLWERVPQVAAVIDDVTDAAVTRADPGVYSSGGHELPSYEISVEVSL